MWLAEIIAYEPLVVFCYESSASLNEVVVSESEEVHQSSGTHTSLRRRGNKVFHLSTVVNGCNIVLLFNW